MLQKLYIHNFRCLQNFEFAPASPSCLVIGPNGSGKSTIALVLQRLSSIGRGETSVSEIIRENDFSFFNREFPIRLEISASVKGNSYKYSMEIDFPENFKQARISREELLCNGAVSFRRKLGDIEYWPRADRDPSLFHLDWHKIGLAQIGDPARDMNLENFRIWLAQIFVLSPVPTLIGGDSHDEAQYLSCACENFASYLRWLLSEHPAAYNHIVEYVKAFMHDIDSFMNKAFSRETRELIVKFAGDLSELSLKFDYLSDGGKCFFISAAVQAAINYMDDALVYWDEPDNFISLWVVEKLISRMRQISNPGGMYLISSHNPQAINCFSPDAIYLLSRPNHLLPTRIRNIAPEMDAHDDVVELIQTNVLL